MKAGGAALGCCAVVLLLIACAPAQAPATERYRRWLDDGHREQVGLYEAYLHSRQLDRVFPMMDVLRTGRRWQRCRANEFAVPPAQDWTSMSATLALAVDLRDAGILKDARIASAWRSADFNRCEGGSPRSRHLHNNALDFDLQSSADVRKLCDYWHRQGAARGFGLGFYSTRQIHIDTSGFRTWGQDHHRETSLCVAWGPANSRL